MTQGAIVNGKERGRIMKKQSRKIHVSKEEDDKLVRLADSLSLQNKFIKKSLHEELESVHIEVAESLEHTRREHKDRIEEAKNRIEQTTSPFQLQEINDLKVEMENLVAWDEEYFTKREQLMQDLVEIFHLHMNYDTDVYLTPAKEVLKQVEELVTKSLAEFGQKLKECDAAEAAAKKKLIAGMDF